MPQVCRNFHRRALSELTGGGSTYSYTRDPFGVFDIIVARDV